jgi:hypothetical protein
VEIVPSVEIACEKEWRLNFTACGILRPLSGVKNQLSVFNTYLSSAFAFNLENTSKR